MRPQLTQQERFPILSPGGQAFLHRMRQHPHAPVWNWPNGEQLDHDGLQRVEKFQRELVTQASDQSLEEPEWLAAFVKRCVDDVPFYRRRTPSHATFENIPTCSRTDLASRTWDFVPDSEPLDELVVFSSSGTTGHPTRTPHHPFSAACGVPLIEYALRELHGIDIPRGAGNVAITNIVAYPDAFTTAITVSYLQEAGCVRVNLDPSAWRRLSDRERYINQWRGPIWLGDPIAFEAMEQLIIDFNPQAIVSSIMHLTDEHATRLNERYQCPVVDLYAMTEAGIIAARARNGYRILPHDLFVEILDEKGARCPPGVRGEITLTGGRNPFLPLLRYRTADYAALEAIDGNRTLVDFQGRQPIEYRSSHGRAVHSMELTRLMRRYPVYRYQMQVANSDSMILQVHGDLDRAAFEADVANLFGTLVRVSYADQPS